MKISLHSKIYLITLKTISIVSIYGKTFVAYKKYKHKHRIKQDRDIVLFLFLYGALAAIFSIDQQKLLIILLISVFNFLVKYSPPLRNILPAKFFFLQRQQKQVSLLNLIS